MNIQQVKGEVGDGEEDITAESLTKYEKAAKDLGVALKEVKDGAAVLRDPMAVLNDLAEAFNKEADDSIKKANLINAIGGKYRGNQLAALLSNWETYKEILEDFNSDKALGSAVRESQKDVASWTGQVTILKNNWDAFIDSVVNSDTAIGTLKALNGVLEMLKTTSKGIGGLGTVSTLIAGLAGAKGSGILSYIQKNSALNKQIAGITLDDVSALRQYNALLTQGVSAAEANATALGAASASARQLATNANGAAVSEEVLAQAQKKLTSGTRAATIAMKALNTALNIVINMAVVAGISAVIKLIDKLIVTEKEAAEQAAEMREKSYEAVVEFQNESKQLNDIERQYAQIITSTTDLSTQKEKLLDLQKQLPDTYKEEADGIDFVNGKISENIRLLDEKRQKEAEVYVANNQGAYETALQELSKRSTLAFNASGLKSFISNDDVRKFLLTLDNVVKNSESWTGLQSDAFADFTISGTYEEQLNTLVQIRDFYKDLDGHNTTWLSQLDEEITNIQGIVDTNKAITSEMEKQRDILSITSQEYNMIEQATLAYREYQTALSNEDTKGAANALNVLEGIRDVVMSMPNQALKDEFNEVWDTFNLGAENALSNLTQIQADFDKMLDETFDEELKNIDNIGNAIESMMNDETLSHDDAWNIIKLDTDGILKDIKLVNGEYKLSTDELLRLMQQRIDKQKESIKLIKADAEAELANAKARLASIKINSLGDVKAYAEILEEINNDIKDSQAIITQSSYLLDELETKGRKIERIADNTGKILDANVKALEAEVEAIDNTIDNLNDRKDIIEDEKKALEDELEILNEQKEALEQTIKNYDAVADAVSDYVKEQTNGIQKQIDALEEEHDAIEKFYNDQIDALKEQNEERDAAIKKEKALADLTNAENQKKRTYSSARGWTYESSKEDIVQAQNALAEIETEEKIKALEKERDTKLGGFDERKKEYEAQIKAFEEYAEKYSSIASDIQKVENELLADQILGSEWRTQIEQKDEELLNNYRSEYQQFNNDLKNLVNNEIANLQASIDKKDEEIEKIDDEINAYNKYKKSVENSLKEAQKALEDYKTAVEQTSQDVSKALETMEGNGWDRNWKMKQYNDEMAKSAESASERMCAAYGAVAAALAELQGDIPVGLGAAVGLIMGIKGSHAKGGVADYTGLAMLHGSKSNPETIFNASDSKKLYDMIHNTPDLMASMFKEATQIAGFNPSNVKNSTNTSSINVNIGQVVANNPQELTRNLDTHLDSYFRRKLTQGYAQ